jgi:hypothetical protein
MEGNQTMIKIRNPNNPGQIVLILVLVTIVSLTIGLSLISRTISDVRISSQIEQSGRAFSAAEAGIETALKGAVVGQVVPTIHLGEATAQYSVENLGGDSDVFTYPYTEVGSNQTFWLFNHDSDGTYNESNPSYVTNGPIEICWGSDMNNPPPAIVISLYYKIGNYYKVAKGAYDEFVRNNFISSDLGGGNYCNGNFRFHKTIIPTADFGIAAGAKLLFLRLSPVFNRTGIAVKLNGNVSVQGKTIYSVGKTLTGIVRKMQVKEGYYMLPALLDFGLFIENSN